MPWYFPGQVYLPWFLAFKKWKIPWFDITILVMHLIEWVKGFAWISVSWTFRSLWQLLAMMIDCNRNWLYSHAITKNDLRGDYYMGLSEPNIPPRWVERFALDQWVNHLDLVTCIKNISLVNKWVKFDGQDSLRGRCYF